jgi:branched-chain amino acid transport system substrate-binding protein
MYWFRLVRDQKKDEELCMKLTKSALLVLAVLLAGGMAFAGASGEAAGGNDVAQGIKIAACGAFSGAAAASGMEMYNSFQLAVDERNAAGGINGVQVELLWGDDGGDASQGVTVMEKLTSDKLVYGILGPNFSSVVEAGLRISSEAGVAQISSAASRPTLTEKGYNNFFRVCSRDDDYGPAVARYIVEDLGVSSVYLLNNKDSYAQGLADQIAQTLEELGLPTLYRDTIVAGAKDYSSVLTKVKAEAPELIFVAATDAPDHTALVMQMRDLGIKSIYFGSEGSKDQMDFVEASQGAAEGTYTFHMAPDIYAIDSAADYVSAYEAKYGVLSGWGPTAYEAANIMLDAIEAAAADGKISREEVRQNVADTNYTGILGFPINFNENGDMEKRVTYIFRVEDSKFVQLKLMN